MNGNAYDKVDLKTRIEFTISNYLDKNYILDAIEEDKQSSLRWVETQYFSNKQICHQMFIMRYLYPLKIKKKP